MARWVEREHPRDRRGRFARTEDPDDPGRARRTRRRRVAAVGGVAALAGAGALAASPRGRSHARVAYKIVSGNPRTAGEVKRRAAWAAPGSYQRRRRRRRSRGR